MAPEQVLAVAVAGAQAGCHEALFTLGECPEERCSEAREWLADQGHRSTVDYLAAMCELVLTETGLLPHANAGALGAEDLGLLRPVTASQCMMIESLRDDLASQLASARLIPDPCNRSGFNVVLAFSTLPQRFTYVRLPDPHLTHHVRLFLNAHHNSR